VGELGKNQAGGKQGTHLERKSAFDGIPRHLPALLRAEKLVKKAQKIGLATANGNKRKLTKATVAAELFELATRAQGRGWCAEELLATEIKKRERQLRRQEKPPRKQGWFFALAGSVGFSFAR